MDRISTDETKTSSKNDDAIGDHMANRGSIDAAPVSFVRMGVNESELQMRLFDELESTGSVRHGLDGADSIRSYLRQVDEAYENLLPRYKPDANDDEFYTTEKGFDQSISLLTIDPALVYRHSIFIDDYSASFQSIGSAIYKGEEALEGSVARLYLTEL
jgi:hypothetical protein